ncbi:hypothetical protein FACS1894211_05650 [Clostridia bacterium]|nr:hypothetical protein FACS1894211_05650 [Clostridia bacterium]
MKRLVIITALLALIFGAAFTEFFVLKNTFTRIETEAAAIKTEMNIDKEHIDTQSILKKVQNLEDFWLSRKPAASVMINQILLMEYTAILGRLKTNIQINEYPMAQVEADNLLRQTNELRELHKPYVKNIF